MKTKIMLIAMIVMAIAMKGFAEMSSADTLSSITIDNTVPEPGTLLLLVVLLMFKTIRR
jgi:hypothetical protein